MSNLKIFRPAIILCLICLITTGLISLTYELTREERELQAENAANTNRLALFPKAEEFLPMDLPEPAPEGLLEVLMVKASDGSLLGYLISASKRGYGGQVPVMVAVSPDGVILGVRVLDNDETPGLGKKVEQNQFLNQFVNKSVQKPFALSIQSGDFQPIDAISGATISSRAVTEAVNMAVLAFEQIKEGS